MVVVERESVEYLAVDVSSDVVIDDDVPQFAFVLKDPEADPDAPPDRPAVWFDGTWQGDQVHALGKYRRTARTPLIGTLPDLAPGEYQAWIRWVDDPEVPVMKAGVLFVG